MCTTTINYPVKKTNWGLITSKPLKGIVLAGGAGTRLSPITKGTSKQLLPVYDKPMIYYPLSVLMLAGIRDILIITTPEEQDSFKRLLGDGSDFGIHLQYAVQEKPNGIAEAFIIGEEFLDGSPACLVLGDNIFHGQFSRHLQEAVDYSSDRLITSSNKGESDWDTPGWATIFGYYVSDPERFGVAEFNEYGKCLSIEEKPEHPKSNYAVVGLYFYPNDVVEKVKTIKPSARGELEITTLNQLYLKEDRLHVIKLPRAFAWLDTGTFDSLSDAAGYVETIEKRQGLQIACLEEIAYDKGWIDREKVRELAEPMKKNTYGQYLLKRIEQ